MSQGCSCLAESTLLVFSSRIPHAKAHGGQRDCNVLLLREQVTCDSVSYTENTYRQTRLPSVCLDLILVTTKEIKISEHYIRSDGLRAQLLPAQRRELSRENGQENN